MTMMHLPSRLHRFNGLGQVAPPAAPTDTLTQAVQALLRERAPSIQAATVEALGPAMAKAAELAKPAIRAVMDEYWPKMALLAGAVIGGAYLIGVWYAKKR